MGVSFRERGSEFSLVRVGSARVWECVFVSECEFLRVMSFSVVRDRAREERRHRDSVRVIFQEW